MNGARRKLAAAIIMALLALAFMNGSNAPDPGLPASPEQRHVFLTLIQQYQRVFFDGWMTGDLSNFPAVFYNDPAYPPNSLVKQLILRHREEIDADIASATAGPVGARTGELAAQMADVITRRQSSAFGASAWIEKTIFIENATLQGERHATVVYVVDSPDSTLLFHLHLTNVDGTWYISDMWTTGNP